MPASLEQVRAPPRLPAAGLPAAGLPAAGAAALGDSWRDALAAQLAEAVLEQVECRAAAAEESLWLRGQQEICSIREEHAAQKHQMQHQLSTCAEICRGLEQENAVLRRGIEVIVKHLGQVRASHAPAPAPRSAGPALGHAAARYRRAQLPGLADARRLAASEEPLPSVGRASRAEEVGEVGEVGEALGAPGPLGAVPLSVPAPFPPRSGQGPPDNPEGADQSGTAPPGCGPPPRAGPPAGPPRGAMDPPPRGQAPQQPDVPAGAARQFAPIPAAARGSLAVEGRAGAVPEAADGPAAGMSAVEVADTRLTDRPKGFNGKDEDRHEWNMMTRACASAISDQLLYLMGEAKTADNAANAVLERDKDRYVNNPLYYILALWLERQLADLHEVKVVTRTTGLYQQILNFGFDSDHLPNELGRFEKVFRQYEYVADKEAYENLRIGIVSQIFRQGEMLRNLIMNSGWFDTDGKIRDGTSKVFRTERCLIQGSAPIDVGAVDGLKTCGDICGQPGQRQVLDVDGEVLVTHAVRGFFGEKSEIVQLESGAAPFVIIACSAEIVAQVVAYAGQSRLVFKSGGEAAVSEVRRTGWQIAATPEESPVGDSKTNGYVEKEIWDAQSLAKLRGDMLQAADLFMVCELPYASHLLDRSRRSGGRAAFERWKGRPCRGRLLDPGVVVMLFAVADGERDRKPDMRFYAGMYVGLVDRADEVIVLVMIGYFVAIAHRGHPEEQGLPWLGPHQAGGDAETVLPFVAAAPIVPADRQPPPEFEFRLQLQALPGCQGNQARSCPLRGVSAGVEQAVAANADLAPCLLGGAEGAMHPLGRQPLRRQFWSAGRCAAMTASYQDGGDVARMEDLGPFVTGADADLPKVGGIEIERCVISRGGEPGVFEAIWRGEILARAFELGLAPGKKPLSLIGSLRGTVWTGFLSSGQAEEETVGDFARVALVCADACAMAPCAARSWGAEAIQGLSELQVANDWCEAGQTIALRGDGARGIPVPKSGRRAPPAPPLAGRCRGPRGQRPACARIGAATSVDGLGAGCAVDAESREMLRLPENARRIYDRVAGAQLLPDLAAAACRSDIEIFRCLPVCKEVGASEARGPRVIDARRFDVNAGDRANVNVSSQLWSMEFARQNHWLEEAFAGAPPWGRVEMAPGGAATGAER
ncbi:unnamed protein product [Prorocentrum cordatum]|uniref:RNA-directed RNA polymerase n=1 Tax=Prorocentrum cordatum TaxID=2364126 RepID=A0ABN9UGC1_9DINO|nr:unnamed protein product [Polarella glacialis]